MALTTTEEALLRDLLAKQAPLIALANNETTITAKLGSTKATIDDLTAATTVADADLMIVRQGGVDKKLPVSVVKSGLVDLSSYAPLASPALTGAPTAPTATAGTNTKQIATTAFVQAEKPAVATQAEMEAGTETAIRGMSPKNVAQAIAAKSSGGIRGQVFTSSGTFTVPNGVTAVKVRGCGGGSGGGSSPGAGGTTSFGAYCSATGGSGTTPGTGSGGDINLAGGNGGKTNAVVGSQASGGAVGGGYGDGGASSTESLAAPTGLLGGSGHSAAAATGYGNGGGCVSNTGTATSTAGSAGGYFEKYISGLTPGAAITVTIGKSGAAGTSGRAGAPGICIVEW